MRVKISVTQEDIDQGAAQKAYGDAWTCPASEACSRVMNERAYVYIAISVKSKGLLPGEQICDLPPRAAQWVDDFDNRERVKPISFFVDIPKKYLKPEIIARRRKKKPCRTKTRSR